MFIFEDTCRCGVICTCGGDDWGEESMADIIPEDWCGEAMT